ncbi:Neurochondrin [Trichoplax sp. H2]|nr:Neurochondrin [Trichoplax sp. H2]|eukprot:RDD39380.1 Neurochondrin [Trichoplax sp. H2]
MNENQQSDDAFLNCIDLLQASDNDSQKFAALLLVTKLIQSENLNLESKRRLFSAIGVNFIIRLLKSAQVPSGCDPNIFKTLAVTVLSAFCDDEAIFHVNIFFGSTSQGFQSQAECYQCLHAASSYQVGRQYLLKLNAIETLSRIVTKCETISESESPLQILLNLLHDCNLSLPEQKASVTSLLEFSSHQFATNHENEKFVICRKISAILLATKGCQDILGQSSIKCIRQGLWDILRSRVGAKHREPTFELCAEMIRKMQFIWIKSDDLQYTEEDIKMLLILVNLSCVEVQVQLKTNAPGQLFLDTCILSSCFFIIESFISCISSPTDIAKQVTNDHIMYLRPMLNETFISVTEYVQMITMEKNFFNKPEPLLIACLRLLAAYLAEDSSLSNRIYEVLPHILKISYVEFDQATAEGSLLDDSRGALLIRFYLPGLCHLTAEEDACKIMADNGGISFLTKYFLRMYSDFSKKRLQRNDKSCDIEFFETTLKLLCGIFLNISLVYPIAIRSCPECSGMLTTMLVNSDVDVDAVSTTVAINITALSFALIECKANAKGGIDMMPNDTFKASLANKLNFIGLATPNVVLNSNDRPSNWEEHVELWTVVNRALLGVLRLNVDYYMEIVNKSTFLQSVYDWTQVLSVSNHIYEQNNYMIDLLQTVEELFICCIQCRHGLRTIQKMIEPKSWATMIRNLNMARLKDYVDITHVNVD